MSELTPCNWCTMQSMLRTARKRGAELLIAYGPPGGWVIVGYSDRLEPSAWFMHLTGECVC